MKVLFIVNMIRKLGISIVFSGRNFIVFIYVELFFLIIFMGSVGKNKMDFNKIFIVLMIIIVSIVKLNMVDILF